MALANFKVFEGKDPTRFSGTTRWIALATGCVAWVLPPAAIMGAPLLIVGAIAQPFSLRSGKWLAFTGALFLSVPMLPLLFRLVIPLLLGDFHRFQGKVVLLTGYVVAGVLILWCDACLALDTWRSRGTRHNEEPRPTNLADVIIWIVSIWPLLIQYRRLAELPRLVRGANWEGVLRGSVFPLILLTLYVALVRDVLDRRQSRRMHTNI